MSPGPDLSLTTLSARLIDSVRINKTVEVQRGAKPFLLKRRYAGRGWIIQVGNLFLKLSNSQIIMFPDAKRWQEWEIHSFTLLYRAECVAVGTNAIMSVKLPGISLKHLLEQGRLSEAIVAAAGREFRRAHSIHSNLTGKLWSHGDPHLDNVLYDSEAGNVYLIDFETQHWKNLTSVVCHADDLLVFVLDLLGRDSAEQWKSHVRAFLASYDQADILNNLYERLKMPRGSERVLWKARTANMSTEQLRHRLADLREIVGELI